jgi:hypothetical protein
MASDGKLYREMAIVHQESSENKTAPKKDETW